MTGRPVSSGSVVDAEGGVRAYLHVDRLRRIAARVGGKEGQLLEAAAEAMRTLAAKNQKLGRQVGARMQRSQVKHRGESVPLAQAAERICELASDAPVVAYIGRDKGRVRITTGDKLPRGAKRIGRFDISADYRDVKRRVEQVAA